MNPTSSEAEQIVNSALHKNIVSIERFPTGLAHFVFDVKTDTGEELVVRLSRPTDEEKVKNAIYWNKKLREVNVPMPEVFYAEANPEIHGFPVMIMQRLKGSDLGIVYPTLSKEQKKEIAKRNAEIQRKVAELPKGKGFGYGAESNDPKLLPNWEDVLNTNLKRSRERFEKTKVISTHVYTEVDNLMTKYKDLLDSVEPNCFLDDTTTKNVIIEQGKLSGIVDVDFVAFGDSLYTVALTRMSLLGKKYDTDYIDFWIEELQVSEDQKKLLDLYTIIFCLDITSELGLKFNQDTHIEIDQKVVEERTDLLKTFISKLN